MKSLNYERISKHLLFIFLGLYIFVLFLNYFKNLPSILPIKIFFILFFISFIFYFMQKIKKIPLEERKNSKLVYIFAHLFLLTLIIFALNQFLKRQIIIDYLFYFLIVSIVSGFLIFYAYFNKIENEIDNERINEEIVEKNRYNEFETKFPRFGNIFFLGKFIRWMYAEGWKYSAGLILILIYAAFLIFSGLENNNLYHDEHWHYDVLQSLNNGAGFKIWNNIGQFPMLEDSNGKIFNSLVYFTTHIFSENVFFMRAISAIFGILILVITYFISKKFISKGLSLLVVFFLSNNFLFLYLARFLRPYTSFLFFYLIVFFILINPPKNKKNKLFWIINLIIFVIFSIIEREISKILLIMIPIIILIYNFKKIKNIKIISGIVGLSLIIIYYSKSFLIKFEIIQQFVKYIDFKTLLIYDKSYYLYLFEILFKNFYLILIFILFGFLFFTNKKNNRYLVTIFFIIPLLFIVHFLKMHYDPRYIFQIIPFLILVIVSGISLISKILVRNNINLRKLLFILLVLFSFYFILPMASMDNFSYNIPSKWSDNEITHLFHQRGVAPEYEKVYSKLNSMQQKGDIIIIVDGQSYINPKNNITYYGIDPWSYSSDLYDLRYYNRESWEYVPENTLNFFDVIKNKSFYFVGAYVLMLDPEINNYLLDNCKNIAEELKIKKYNPWPTKYSNKFYYPNLFYCES